MGIPADKPQYEPLCRLYVDEVGNHDLKHADDDNCRFLSLTGVMFESTHMSEVVQPQLRALKRDFLAGDPDEPVILHRKDMTNCRGPFTVLRDAATRARFDERLLFMLAEWNYAVITVVIDKRKHMETYKAWRYHPYHYCLHVMLERYVLRLDAVDGRGDVMVERRGAVEDTKLKDSFRRTYQTGTDWVSGELFRSRLTSGELKVKPKSADIAGLQIADVLAYPSYRDVLSANGLCQGRGCFGEKICAILNRKYHKHPRTGEIDGAGRKLLP